MFQRGRVRLTSARRIEVIYISSMLVRADTLWQIIDFQYERPGLEFM